MASPSGKDTLKSDSQLYGLTFRFPVHKRWMTDPMSCCEHKKAYLPVGPFNGGRPASPPARRRCARWDSTPAAAHMHQSIALPLRPHTTPLSLSDRPRLTAAVFTWLKLQSTTPPCGMQLIRARWDSLCSRISRSHFHCAHTPHRCHSRTGRV